MSKIVQIVFLALFGLCGLYILICSLGLLSLTGKLLAGKNAISLFANQEPLMKKPLVDFSFGLYLTVLTQSSATTISTTIVDIVSKDTILVKSDFLQYSVDNYPN